MLASRSLLRVILLTSLLFLLAAVPGFASERKKEVKSPVKQAATQPVAGHFTVSVETPSAAKPAQPEAAVAPAPEPPPVQLTLAQKPAVPPQVQYQNGQLTITAENSTLGDILRAVQKQTGTTIDLPGSATERVVIHVGPAPTHDVLVSLLDGSSFNYVMVGSPTDPRAVTRVVLSPKPPGGGEMASAGMPGQTPTQPPVPMASPQPFAGRTRTMEDAPEAQADADNDDADDQPQAADQPPADEQTPPDQAGQQPGAPSVIKTPQQMLEELQRQQQQQQIQQGTQGPTPEQR